MDEHEAKLIFISLDHKNRLMEIKEAISQVGGNVSLNQLIRDAIDLLIYAHSDEIIEYHKPKKIEELIQKQTGDV